MLVLSRRKNESVVIGGDVVVTVVRIEGDRVHLGVEAPREVPVDRDEVWAKKRRKRAATADIGGEG